MKQKTRTKNNWTKLSIKGEARKNYKFYHSCGSTLAFPKKKSFYFSDDLASRARGSKPRRRGKRETDNQQNRISTKSISNYRVAAVNY
jgi:hypothetical protein